MLFFDGDGRGATPLIIEISEIMLYAGIIHQNLNIAYHNMRIDKQIPITPEVLNLQARQVQK